jgi:hypothetical protein
LASTACGNAPGYDTLFFFETFRTTLQMLTVPQFIQSTCATSGDGLFEGLDWLATEIKKNN